jgi:N-acetylglutamate synthase-like GNAT family acetyltransferase
MADKPVEVKIRPFSTDLANAVVELILPIQRSEFHIPLTLADQPDLRNIPAFYQTGNGQFWVAVAAGRVVGAVGLRDLGDGQAALRKMFVHRDWRGRPGEPGLGQRLFDALLDHARVRRFQCIHIGTTATFLAAHRFYERNGFVRVPWSALPANFPRMAVDSRFYIRNLTPELPPPPSWSDG